MDKRQDVFKDTENPQLQLQQAGEHDSQCDTNLKHFMNYYAIKRHGSFDSICHAQNYLNAKLKVIKVNSATKSPPQIYTFT